MILLLFWTFTLGGCGYAAALGGRDGKVAASLLMAASLLSVPAILMGRRWLQTETGVLIVDAALLLGLYALALRTRHFFPLWMTGMQLVAVTTHFATLIAPQFTPRIYQALEQVWAIPITVVMVLGVKLDYDMSMRQAAGRTIP